MASKIQTLKGFRDFLPKDALKRQWLKKRLSEICESWGFDPMETPTLEPLELFQGQIGEDEKLFYKFTDNGGRDVALRYDQTVPTCRVVGQYYQQLTFPFRRYQIQQAYRAENTQKGRYREFTQCDADIFGVASPTADAEVIALSIDIYKQLGFKEAVVSVNDRSLLKELPYKAIVAMDKLEKIGKDGVKKEMEAKGISKENITKYFDLVSSIKPNETIDVIFEYLDKMGFNKSWYKFEPTLARSFSYSTGPIWEVKIPGFESGSVLGGERFDKLIENVSGVSVPGTGFGLGFDRTLEACEQFGLIPAKDTSTQVLVTIFEKKLSEKSAQISSDLRNLGVNVELYPDTEARLDKQIKYADKKTIPWVIIIGPEEVDKKVVTLKNLERKSQEQLTIKDAVSKIKSS